MKVCDICQKRIGTGFRGEMIIQLVSGATGTQYYEICGKCGRKIKRFIIISSQMHAKAKK